MCMSTNLKCEIKLFNFAQTILCYHTVAPSFLACESVLSTAYTVLVGTFTYTYSTVQLEVNDIWPVLL